MKHEYRIIVTYTEHVSVYVEAENEDEAIEKAEQAYHNGDGEQTYENFESTVDWTSNPDAED